MRYYLELQIPEVDWFRAFRLYLQWTLDCSRGLTCLIWASHIIHSFISQHLRNFFFDHSTWIEYDSINSSKNTPIRSLLNQTHSFGLPSTLFSVAVSLSVMFQVEALSDWLPVYSNSFLATLNARKALRDRACSQEMLSLSIRDIQRNSARFDSHRKAVSIHVFCASGCSIWPPLVTTKSFRTRHSPSLSADHPTSHRVLVMLQSVLLAHPTFEPLLSTVSLHRRYGSTHLRRTMQYRRY